MKKLLVILMSLPFLIQAQDYQFHCPIDTPSTSAFYAINLDENVSGRASTSWSDLRLLDQKGQQVPYFIEQSARIYETEVFSEYEIIQHDYSGRRTTIILSNPDQTAIDNVSLFIKNAESRKRATISGSDDMNQWFVVRERLCMQGGQSTTDTQELRLLNFPLIDYKFIKLVIFDCWVDPLNITQAGSYNYQTIQGQYTAFNAPLIEQIVDSNYDKTSLYKLTFDRNYPINRFSISIEGPEYYHRRASIFTQHEVKSSKRKWKKGNVKTRLVERSLVDITISSASINAYDLDISAGREYYIRIFNQDNPPLMVQRLQPNMLKTHLVAHLEAGQPYFLHFGDSDLHAPVYDLNYFRSNVPKDLEFLSLGKIEKGRAEETKPRLADIGSKQILWVVLSLIGLVVIVFSIQMLRSPQEEESEYSQ